jgi:hypothetical protein
MGAWLARLAERRAHGNTAKTDESPATERVSAVSAVMAGASGSSSDDPATDPFRRWQLRNAEQLTDSSLGLKNDPGGYCAAHRRCLSWPEQKRGACSWCVAVDPEREPEYWASHWRRFTERS